jgi:signal transduction histidine kinase/putative methionine-R-sulfoxide reductase with GAF domain
MMPDPSERVVTLDDYSDSLANLIGATSIKGGEGLYFRVAAIAARLTEAKHGVLVLPDPPDKLRVAGCFGEPTTTLEVFSSDRGIIAKAFHDRRYVLVPDVKDEAPYLPYRYHEFDPLVRSELAVPVLDMSRNSVEAVINVESEELKHFGRDDAELLQKLGRLMLLYQQRLAEIAAVAAERDGVARERGAFAEILWNLPDEVMVIDPEYRPIWANLVKREGLPGLHKFLPERRQSESDLAELWAGRKWPKPGREDTCYWNIEERRQLCSLCVCRRAMLLERIVQGVLYKPENLDFIVELSATPLIPKPGGELVGCVETARRVTMRQRVLDIAPAAWKGPTEPKALEAIIRVLHDELGYGRIRLYDVDKQNGKLTAITLTPDHVGFPAAEFSGIERSIPEPLVEILVGAKKAALLVPDDSIQETTKEESFGYWEARVPRSTVTTAFDPDGRLQLDLVEEIVAIPLTVGQQRWLLCIDWLGPSGPRRKFNYDDLQALTIYSTLASPALESVRQRELRSRLAVLGEATAGLADTLALVTDVPEAAPNEHVRRNNPTELLEELLRSWARCMSRMPGGEPHEFLAATFDAIASYLTPDADIPVTGEIKEDAQKVKAALDDAKVDLPLRVLAQIVRVLSRANVSTETTVSAMRELAGTPWPETLARLVRLAVALKTQGNTVRNLAALARAVNEGAGAAEWEIVTREQADLNRIVAAAVGAYRGRAERSGVDLDLRPEAAPLNVAVRQRDILVAWLALLDNAVDAARAERSGGVVKVTTTHKEAQAVVAISNNGARVPPDKVDMLGKERFTTKPEGNGIGLIIVWDLVHANDGKIRHEYDGETGMTTFTTTLPLA